MIARLHVGWARWARYGRWVAGAAVLVFACTTVIMSTSGCSDDQCGYAFTVVSQDECNSLASMLNCGNTNLQNSLCSLEDCDCYSLGNSPCDLEFTVNNMNQCNARAAQFTCADSSFEGMSCSLTGCNCGCAYVLPAESVDDCNNLSAGFACVEAVFSGNSCSLCACTICVGPATTPGILSVCEGGS